MHWDNTRCDNPLSIYRLMLDLQMSVSQMTTVKNNIVVNNLTNIHGNAKTYHDQISTQDNWKDKTFCNNNIRHKKGT